MSLWCLHFLPKNEQKQVNLTYHRIKSNSFVCFLEETSAWKNHFGFVWLLAKFVLPGLEWVDNFKSRKLFLPDNFRMSLWNNRLSQNSNEKISKISVLEVYYFKVSTKQSLSSCKQNIDSLFVLTLK